MGVPLPRRETLLGLVVLAVFLAAWEWLPGAFGVPAFIIPPVSAGGGAFLHLARTENLLLHTGITAAEVAAGFALGSLLGMVVGYLLGMSPTAELLLSPYILALQIAPKVAFAPLFAPPKLPIWPLGIRKDGPSFTCGPGYGRVLGL